MTIAIIGAGMAGLSCARTLTANGIRVALFDKARGPGGRMASRRVPTPQGDATFDHGAQFFTAHDPAFAAQLSRWADAGVIAPWPPAGEGCWTGSPTMNALPKFLASGLDVAAGHFVRGFTRNADGWTLLHDQGSAGPFDGIVVALPADQAATLLSLQDMAMAREAIGAASVPCWTLMLAFAGALDCPPVIRDGPIISWAAANRSKPGRTGPHGWTIHASAEWSRRNLEGDPETVAAVLRNEFALAIGAPLPPPLAAIAHRWRFALPATGPGQVLWNADIGLGACGDWLLGATVESAWLSGVRLAHGILASG